MSLMSLRGRKAVEYFMHFQGWNLSWDKRKKRSHKMSKRLIETKQSIKNLVVEREAVAVELHHLRPEFPKMAVQANTLIIIQKFHFQNVNIEEDTESSSDYIGKTSDDEHSGWW
ncbi:uncharacterized protein LOC112459718 isoform X2 [Temnothorax curvispinosus]|uniref:Uncharacterized protein LOC112459718 isoform X2 n=1 Tax=Temnothorax curvispinosus TaxID=300111 RepID=A0A6J1QBV4_9HYME|nr:uncharacterized protein LOC112459718 isoform X2 [Temnothorax curvispinosus]